MPNWCYTQFKIEGSEKELKLLLAKIKEWTSKNYMENGFGTAWLGNIVLGAGLNINDFPCRGYLAYINDTINTHTDGSKYIEFETETAWVTMDDMWYAILDKFASNCEIYYEGLEIGCEYYETNDINCKYFDDEYYIQSVKITKNSKYIKEKAPNLSKVQYDNWLNKEDLTDLLREIFNKPKENYNELMNRVKDFNEHTEDDQIYILKKEYVA